MALGNFPEWRGALEHLWSSGAYGEITCLRAGCGKQKTADNEHDTDCGVVGRPFPGSFFDPSADDAIRARIAEIRKSEGRET